MWRYKMRLDKIILVSSFILLFAVSSVYANGATVNNNNSGATVNNSNNGGGSNGGGSTSTSTSTATSTSTSTGGSGGSGGSGEGTGGDASFTDESMSYTAPSLTAAKGTDILQVGSPFGSLTLANDTMSSDLRDNVEVIMELHEAEAITDEELRAFARHTLYGLVVESTEDKCLLGLVKCGRRRKITNLFKLL
ncbi:MAG TPA: hypothetical protein ENH82_09955 [bacterium]|nr:hypothetical protein [bacterium]